MNPVVLDFGPITLHAYTAWLTGGILLALGVITWCAYRRQPSDVARWLDTGIAAVLGGIVGARLLHVALEWEYFSAYPGEITKISLGGMAWHGALVTGIPAALVAARVRRVSLKPWMDAAALAWPVGMSAAWLACRRAGCGYGYEVRTLADWPGWLVHELPDVYGFVVPRLEVQLGGVLLSAVLLALAALLTWCGWLPGVRLWIVLALGSLGLCLLGFFRADPAQRIGDRRADQVFDLMVVFLSALTGSMIWLLGRRDRHRAQTTEVSTESLESTTP